MLRCKYISDISTLDRIYHNNWPDPDGTEVITNIIIIVRENRVKFRNDCVKAYTTYNENEKTIFHTDDGIYFTIEEDTENFKET